MAGRLFVLLPLLELWPQAAWPDWGRAQDLAAQLPDQRIERIAAPPRWQALQAEAA